MYRYERKFVTNKIDEVLKANRYLLNNNVLQLNIPYKSRFIHNIYFDDFSNSSLFENLDGSKSKKKIRLRWYNDDTERCRLEIKGKIADYGTKKVWNISLPKLFLNSFLDSKVNYSEFIDIIIKNNPKLDGYMLIVLSRLRPVSYNNYFRDYFVDFSDSVRITIDRKLKFYNWRTGFKDLSHFKPGLVIYEMKFSSTETSAITMYDKFIKKFPLRLSKFSKFAYSSYSEELSF